MFKNSWKIAWRHLVKNRLFTILNLAGLAIGLASAITIFWWVGEERSVDANLDPRLYAVMQNIPLDDGGILTSENTPIPLAGALEKEFPEVAEVAVVKMPDQDGNDRGIITAGRSSIKGREAYVTSNFISLFDYHLIQGNLEQAFAPGNRVLLSMDLANKLFHNTTNVIGSTITWSRGPAGRWNGVFTVAGIFANPPANRSQRFDLLFPHSIYAANPDNEISWLSSSPATFVLLKSGANPATFNTKIKDYLRNKFKAGSQEQKWAAGLFAQPLNQRYLYNRYENGRIAGGRIDYIRLFSLIAIFVLVIACINFMNLSTAKAITRIKEVGIQKVIGARRSTLILQYMSEAMLMALLSLGLAILLIGLLRPGIETIIGKPLTVHLTTNTIAAITGITLFTGLLAGSYPALYLSGFKPMAIFKGTATVAARRTPGAARLTLTRLPGIGRLSPGAGWLRKALVVIQFTISAGFIVAVFTIYRQVAVIQTRNLGYNRDHLIHFPNEGAIAASQQTFLAELRTIPGVVRATEMEGDLLGNHSGGGGINWPGKTERIEFAGVYCGFDYLETMGLQLKEGRFFSRDFATDTAAAIFNETAIAAMHLDNPVGKTVTMWGTKRQIIGIVKDFHYESLYKRIAPFFIAYEKNTPNILARLQAGNEQATLARIEALYKQYNPGLPFEYAFVSDDYQTLYSAERQLSQLSRYFAAIAIGVSCLGLFGLTAFSAERRRKEIGIRKVVGASVRNLVVLLSTDFLKLIGISLLIAFPLTAWLMSRWLDNFAYRLPLGPGIFLLAGAVLLLITIITISFQSIKAAIANPIDALRRE